MKKLCPCMQILWYKVLLKIFYFKNMLGSLRDFAWILEVFPNMLFMGKRGNWIYQVILQIGVQKIMSQSNKQHLCCCRISTSVLQHSEVVIWTSWWSKQANRFLNSLGCEAKENSKGKQLAVSTFSFVVEPSVSLLPCRQTQGLGSLREFLKLHQSAYWQKKKQWAREKARAMSVG